MRETGQAGAGNPQPIDQTAEPLARIVEHFEDRFVTRRDVAECNPLPANCPFSKRLPKQREYIAAAIEDGVIPCCRMEPPLWHDVSEPPLCRVEGEEVFRFHYRHAFGAHATIRIGKRRDEIIVDRSYHPDTFDEAERFTALLTDADWDQLQGAVAAADFWSLPRYVRPRLLCLDGYELLVEARRGGRFRVSRFKNPDVLEYRELARTAFDLAGCRRPRNPADRAGSWRP